MMKLEWQLVAGVHGWAGSFFTGASSGTVGTGALIR